VKRSLLAVLVGGALGTGLRLGLDLLVPHGDSDFPVSTLVINILGAFALGFVTARLWPTARPWVRAGLGPGLLGSFTTFSAFAVSLVSLASSGAAWLAALYLVATIALGFGAAWTGIRAGGRPSTLDPVNE
jgi:CrcB protein